MFHSLYLYRYDTELVEISAIRINDGSPEQNSLISVLSPPSTEAGSLLRRCRLVCLARRICAAERMRTVPVQLFTTKLDVGQNNKISVVDTTGMNSMHLASLLNRNLCNRPFLEVVNPGADRRMAGETIERAIALTPDLQTTDAYRLKISENSYAQVKTKMRYFGSDCPGADFINAVHSIMDDPVIDESPVSSAQLQSNNGQSSSANRGK